MTPGSRMDVPETAIQAIAENAPIWGDEWGDEPNFPDTFDMFEYDPQGPDDESQADDIQPDGKPLRAAE
ncbi:MAG: hypothetical protein R3210_02290 [Roseovarius sp.]|nr:hypothetical protein [Roseovarius sp.]